jgi:hypothetical protein
MAATEVQGAARGADPGVPTLTEVLDSGVLGRVARQPENPARDATAAPGAGATTAATASAIEESAVADFVLAEVAPRIDAMFEARLREVLTPALAQAAEHLIEDARQALGLALRDLVDAAVARALTRRDGA